MNNIRTMNIWKSEEKASDNRDEFLNVNISELFLSVRSYNCLKRTGVNTVGDILTFLDEEGNGLRKIRNLGNRSEEEILDKIRELRTAYETSRRGDHGDAASGSNRAADQSGNPKVLVKPKRSVWNRDIEEYHLSRWSLDRLHGCGVKRVCDLYATNPKNEPGWYAVRELFENIARE